MVMELIKNGNLMEVLDKISRANLPFTEKDASNFVHHILLGLNYLHSMSVVHRDLKLENVMVDVQMGQDKIPELVCKLTDFGFATHIEQDQTATQNLGTRIYMAPEIFSKEGYS